MKIDRKKSRDTGIVLAVALSLISLYSQNYSYLPIALLLIFIALLSPIILKPLAWIWFVFGEMMSAVMSRVVLSLVYFFLLVPIALLMRLFGHDFISLKKFKYGQETVLIDRTHRFTSDDLENPF